MLHHDCDCNNCTTIPLNAAENIYLAVEGFSVWTISGAGKEL